MKIIIRRPDINESMKICTLVKNVFIQCIAPDYTQEGIAFFLKVSTPEVLIEKINAGNPAFVAENEKEIIGFIITRNIAHISNFFVDVRFQKSGIGKLLFGNLINDLTVNHKNVTEVSVFSSPFAFKIYEKFGFIKN